MKCKNCDKELDGSYEPKGKDTEFCSTFCARSYSGKCVDDNELKQAECVSCGKEIGIKKRASPKTCKCDNCKILIPDRDENGNKIKKKKFCKVCGQEKPCPRPDVCRKHQLFPTLAEYFGFDLSKKGTIDIYEEFDRVRNILIEDYGIDKLSTTDISNKYDFSCPKNINKILKSLDIDTRNSSEKAKNIILQNKGNNPHSLYYDHGGHTTGNNKQVFYRSSYELEYAQYLDEQQIDYDMEGLRILYWDSQLLKQRVAIPDFYLPEHGIIVEIKSTGTHDEQNMEDKFKAYKEHGYNCKLVLDKKEYEV